MMNAIIDKGRQWAFIDSRQKIVRAAVLMLTWQSTSVAEYEYAEITPKNSESQALFALRVHPRNLASFCYGISRGRWRETLSG